MSLAADSPRWCDTCQGYGDHHTDRHPDLPDYDTLPPTDQLILDCLASRLRLGETWWPMSTRCGLALRRLEEVGLIWTDSYTTPGQRKAGLTDRGRALTIDPGYVLPVDRWARASKDLAARVEQADEDARAARLERNEWRATADRMRARHAVLLRAITRTRAELAELRAHTNPQVNPEDVD